MTGVAFSVSYLNITPLITTFLFNGYEHNFLISSLHALFNSFAGVVLSSIQSLPCVMRLGACGYSFSGLQGREHIKTDGWVGYSTALLDSWTIKLSVEWLLSLALISLLRSNPLCTSAQCWTDCGAMKISLIAVLLILPAYSASYQGSSKGKCLIYVCIHSRVGSSQCRLLLRSCCRFTWKCYDIRKDNVSLKRSAWCVSLASTMKQICQYATCQLCQMRQLIADKSINWFLSTSVKTHSNMLWFSCHFLNIFVDCRIHMRRQKKRLPLSAQPGLVQVPDEINGQVLSNDLSVLQ